MANGKRMLGLGNTRRVVRTWLSGQGFALRRQHEGPLPESTVWDCGSGDGYMRVLIQSQGYGDGAATEIINITPEGCTGCAKRHLHAAIGEWSCPIQEVAKS